MHDAIQQVKANCKHSFHLYKVHGLHVRQAGAELQGEVGCPGLGGWIARAPRPLDEAWRERVGISWTKEMGCIG